ncbi:unnamed protein product [Fusarium graminearum]|uniref:Lariat debranching enzyme C-terminal domain-containing protein n=1 Tax=Gibberella zeae (strain ATCC MYA-4620 / CBS 123657 / FGSC 9075 / NRRL 31084 / PH-1) TaxID=229533 RepID=I1R9Y6_GIBZE|nr:hypothetical protein FGSG_00302 [Fusarium graminearum PH-1]ESU05465.1 hypothetical protein FGSG_00302 [Fusarium graminearum PH-1]CZS75468.1 unnamed protein product [Fusarium graminearum]|eukprot:XP_011315950.1 hypothetical protein FGSG_00302 [Fusarium graminearum PH-1]
MTTNAFEAQGVRVAIEGCTQGHGTLDAIYASVEESCKQRGWDGVDILIIGGDFQSVRNAEDLSIMSCPVKYRHLGDFPKYYSGERKAPYLTIFIAGNHEASSHLWELYYGGWVAPNIYYMGAANILRFGPLRIAGLSGIWKGFDYRKPHHERLPFSGGDVKSWYHVREIDVRKLLQVQTQVDVGLSHDWPRAVELHGDHEWLFRKKPDFRNESRDGTLGSVAAEYVMDRLRPPHWFSAHMHVKFAAIKTYSEAQPEVEETKQELAPAAAPVPATENNPDEIDLDMDDEDEDTKPNPEPEAKKSEPEVEEAKEASNEVSDELRAQLPASFARPQPKKTPGQPVPPGITNKEVRFLALDKCLPGRHFLQLCDLQPFNPETSSEYPPAQESPRWRLQYDPEWLAITRVFHDSLVIGDSNAQSPPDLGEEHYQPLIKKEREWVEDNIVKAGKLDVPYNFEITAPPHVPGGPEIASEQPSEYTNPQTSKFCEIMELSNIWDATDEERRQRKAQGPPKTDQRFTGGGRGGGRGRGGRGGRGRGRGRGRGGRW